MKQNDFNNSQEIDNLLDFAAKHNNLYGATFSPEFQIIDMTEFCQQIIFKQLLLITHSKSTELYFYADELGLIEFDQINGRKFIPKNLGIEGAELNNALNKHEEFFDVINTIRTNRPKSYYKSQIITVGDIIIRCMTFKNYGTQHYEITFSVNSCPDSGSSKEYIVVENIENCNEITFIKECTQP